MHSKTHPGSCAAIPAAGPAGAAPGGGAMLEYVDTWPPCGATVDVLSSFYNPKENLTHQTNHTL